LYTKAAINREDEEATADMQQDAEVAFYWDGGDYAKNGGAAWFENNRRAGVMFVILAVIACGSAVDACGSVALTQFQFYGDNFADTTLLMSHCHCNQPHDNSGMDFRVYVLLWMALLTLPLLAWQFLPVFKMPPPSSSPMGGFDFTHPKFRCSDIILLARNGLLGMIVCCIHRLHMLVTYFTADTDDAAVDGAAISKAVKTSAALTAVSHACTMAISSPSRSNCWSWTDSNIRWLFFLLVLLTPEAASVAASSLLTSTTINTTATINTWTSLDSAIKAAAGKSTTLTLSASFSGYTTAISIDTAYTNVTIVGNGANLSATGTGQTIRRFFEVGQKAVLVMSNVTLQNGYGGWVGKSGSAGNGGAVYVATGGIFTVTSSTFMGNTIGLYGHGGAVYVASGGTFTVTSSTFMGNYAPYDMSASGGAVYVATGGIFTVTSSTFMGNSAISGDANGGAVYVATGGTFTVTSSTFMGNSVGPGGYTFGGALYFGGIGLIKNCTFVGPISNQHNDIYNKGGNVTFACADDEVGTPVQMQGTEITVIPPKELKCTTSKYLCNTITHTCVQAPTGSTLKECTADCSCVVPLNCGIHNDTTVCSHVFKGCDVCPICCQKYILNDKDCTSCVETECKNGHHECCR
jgi:hypothetical protein